MSLWASGTPCRTPFGPDLASSASASFARASASSASMRTKAFSLGCQCWIRASSACVTSTDDNLRSRICAATCTSESSAGSLNLSSSLARDGHEARRLDLERKLQSELIHAPDRGIDGPGRSRGGVILDRHARSRSECLDALRCHPFTHPLLDLDVRVLDDLCPLGDFGLDECREVLRRIADALEAHRREPLLYVGSRERFGDFRMQLSDAR